ncbi:ATP-binding protein [Desulfobacula phenolica]|uniref:histidine kinase n=1 Tax=Desulfobacula phenolica TaxID=90732 RepID=A0A1H2HW38_9BACT|nr:ATP-binding protein [Desulfobacula phenolica]SDU36130.1 GAF domain-containing protein [Desulfobacula phenolica]
MHIKQRTDELTETLSIPSFEELFDISKIQDAFTRPKGLSNCIQSDAVLGKSHKKKPSIRHCLNTGLWNPDTGINIDENHIAKWLTDQIKNDHTHKTKIMACVKRVGADQEEFKKALEKVTIMPLEQFEQVSESLFLITDQLSELACQKSELKKIVLKQKQAEDQLKVYKNHLEERTAELEKANQLLKKEIAHAKKIEKELKQKNEYLSVLHDTSLGMFSRLDLSKLLNSIIKRASDLTQIPDGFIQIYHPLENILEIKSGCGKYAGLIGKTLKTGEGLSGKVLETGESILLNDYQNWIGKTSDPQFDFATSIIGVPLTSGSNIEGTIGLSHHVNGKKIGSETILILEHFAELASIAIDNANLFKNIKKELEQKTILESERQEMESMLRQSQKMEAIGTLAGGIAHDFNNILFPVIGFAQMIDQDLPYGNPIKSQIKGILNGACRAKELVQQILTFSRQTDKEYQPLRVQLIIKELLKLSRSTLPASIKISNDIPNDVGMIMADPTQIHQIVMNLITNALHAMEENGGELTVKLREVDFEKNTVPSPDLAPGSYICLEVTDTGIGMDEITVKRIFEPYFTTKEKGKGTGLGLAVIHGIVKDYHGKIIVQSSPDNGTSFFVYLPCLHNPRNQIVHNIQPSHKLNGNERLLVVDDEIPITIMLKKILSYFGYQVSSYSNSIEALEAFRNSPEKYDMVITDMTMPNLTGEKLIMELKKIQPAIPVILCTGFSKKIADGRTINVKPNKILMKPVLKDDLLTSIREIFDSSTGTAMEKIQYHAS